MSEISNNGNKVVSVNCKKARLLILPYITNDADITTDEHRAFEQHLQSCAQCIKEYEESKSVVDMVKKCRQVGENSLSLIEKPNYAVDSHMTAEEGWQDLLLRCPDLAQGTKRQNCLQLLYKVSTAAACLIISISSWVIFSSDSKPEINQNNISKQVAFDPFLTVELLSDRDKTTIPAGQKLQTSFNESKTLIINDKHRIVMNADTALSIEPVAINECSGCMVELAFGQIYSHVKRNGNPFIVETSHGKAVITGTTFDMKVTHDTTTLVVTEGSVQFESEKGVVMVTAGQISEIVDQSAPAEPKACDTTELTAWATSNRVKALPTKSNLYEAPSDLDDLGLPIKSEPINLEAIDYESWIEEKRDWFRREFPWIFQLQEALAKEGVEVDYPQLLVQSDYIWQFGYPENSTTRIAVFDFQLLLKAVLSYGLDGQWLLKNVSKTKYAINNRGNTKDRSTSLQAFEQWAAPFKGALKSPKELDSSTLFCSPHAGTYLVNTKTLLWLIINNTTQEVEDEKKLLLLLNQEIQAADKCIQTSIELMATPERTCSTEYQILIEQMIKNIDVISELERAIGELR